LPDCSTIKIPDEQLRYAYEVPFARFQELEDNAPIVENQLKPLSILSLKLNTTVFQLSPHEPKLIDVFLNSLNSRIPDIQLGAIKAISSCGDFNFAEPHLRAILRVDYPKNDLVLAQMIETALTFGASGKDLIKTYVGQLQEIIRSPKDADIFTSAHNQLVTLKSYHIAIGFTD
jgi:hypothetical protein